MMLVVYSLISFACRLIFFAFASTFVWCDQALDLVWLVPAGGAPAAGLRLGSEMVGGGDALVLHGLLHVAPLGEQAASGAGLRELLLVMPVTLPHHVRENHRGVLRHPAVYRVTVHVLTLRVRYTCGKTFHNVIQTSLRYISKFMFYSVKEIVVQASPFLDGLMVYLHWTTRRQKQRPIKIASAEFCGSVRHFRDRYTDFHWVLYIFYWHLSRSGCRALWMNHCNIPEGFTQNLPSKNYQHLKVWEKPLSAEVLSAVWATGRLWCQILVR